jgi:hypothetical protein
MLQKHIHSAAIALNAHRHDAAFYARQADRERQHATSAANEVIASVHESLAFSYAARAAERAGAGNT